MKNQCLHIKHKFIYGAFEFTITKVGSSRFISHLSYSLFCNIYALLFYCSCVDTACLGGGFILFMAIMAPPTIAQTVPPWHPIRHHIQNLWFGLPFTNPFKPINREPTVANIPIGTNGFSRNTDLVF